jgi:hypothetical protein
MIIPTIDAGLEALLRNGLPLPETLGDVSFESPSGTWSAQVHRHPQQRHKSLEISVGIATGALKVGGARRGEPHFTVNRHRRR